MSGLGVIPSANWVSWVSMGLAAVAIVYSGPRLARVCQDVAIRTGWGQALVGILFLGAATSLPGLVTTVVAAAGGHGSLAVSNGIGSIACQTAFLAVADICYRRANLEYSAAAPENLVQGAWVVTQLGLLMLASLVPWLQWMGIHVLTPVCFGSYLLGVQLIRKTKENPRWRVNENEEGEQTESSSDLSLFRLGWTLAFHVAVLFSAGLVLGQLGPSLATQLGFGESVIGVLVTGVITSLPELVTTVAAVRQGALVLAVSNILGGNAFDSLFVAVGDLVYPGESIYAGIATAEQFMIVLTMLMTGVLLMGLTYREKHGIGNIGFESVLLLLIYGLGVGALFTF